MIRAILALGLLLAAVGPAAAARPLRVMSINECADQYVLALLPPAQITSVTWLARDPSISILTAAAAKTRINHGAAEEVLRDRPDLVIAGAYTTLATRQLLKRLRYPMIEIGPADSFDAIRRQTRQVAAAVGQLAAGEALLARMDADLAALAAHPAPPLRVAAWDGAGFAAQPGSLYDTLLRAAGVRNVVAEARGLGSGAPSVEALLASAPQLLVEGQPGSEPDGLRSAVVDSPIVRRIWGDRRVILPTAYYVCGTPFSAGGALRLQSDLRAAAARARAPLPFLRAAR